MTLHYYDLDFCAQFGSDVHSGSFLYSSHGTHRFSHGARSSRSNNQRTGEEMLLKRNVHLLIKQLVLLLFIGVTAPRRTRRN